MHLKKTAIILTILFLLSLSGCGALSPAPDFAPLRAFSLRMTATVREKEFAAVLTRDECGTLTLSFTAPEPIAGFSVRAEEDGWHVDVNGAADLLGESQVREDAPLRLLIDAVRAAVSAAPGAFVYEKETGRFTASLTVNGAPATAAFDTEGRLAELTAGGIRAVFRQ